MKKKSELKVVMIEPRHLGAVDHLHDVQQRAIGIPVDRPKLLKEPVLLAMGFEDEAGALKGGFYLEATAECCFLGLSPDATEAAIQTAPAIFGFLQGRGIRWLRIQVPKKLVRKVTRQMKAAGFTRTDTELATFTRDLRPEDERR